MKEEEENGMKKDEEIGWGRLGASWKKKPV